MFSMARNPDGHSPMVSVSHKLPRAVAACVRRLPNLRPFHQRDAALASRDVALVERDRARARATELERMLNSLAGIEGLDQDLRWGLESADDWQAFISVHPEALNSQLALFIAEHALRSGIHSEFLGHVPPERVVLRENRTTYREHLLADGLNSRQRALLDLFAETFRGRPAQDLRVYAHEALTPMALLLRGRYPLFLGSEYAATPEDEARLYPILSIDAANSPLLSGRFDAVLSADVLEHVPDLDGTLRETARILKPGGHFFATMPFDFRRQRTDVRARLVNGVVEHLAPPEYHINPADPAGGSLVFQIPGWDLLEKCRAGGFSAAKMVFWASARGGIAGDTSLTGVFILAAEK